MSTDNKKKCCNGCKKGLPGQNQQCKAKLLIEQLEKNSKTKVN